MDRLATTDLVRPDVQGIDPHPDSERCYGEREPKRRCLGPTAEQHGATDSPIRDVEDLNDKGTQEEHDMLCLSPGTRFVPHDSALSNSVSYETSRTSNLEPILGFSSTRDVPVPEFDSSEERHDFPPIDRSRGRTPEREEYTHYSPQSRPVSRANSTSSVRSMIDERLEWAHQDRMRSASREGSVPRSPFQEHSPFYAEFAGFKDPALPSNDDKSCRTMSNNLSQDSAAQISKCSRINPSTGKQCNTVFSRPYDLTRHEDTIHHNRATRYVCPHCHGKKSYSRADTFARHLRAVHPESYTRHWSCAALTDPEDVTCHVHHGLSICAYCGMELQGSSSDGPFFEHLVYVHQFRKCDTDIRFSQPGDFRQHLRESHGASSSGEWLNILSNRCFVDGQLDRSSMYTSAGASRASFIPKSSTVGMKESSSQDSNASTRVCRAPLQCKYICECCPRKPKRFYTEDELRVHESTKQYSCAYCPVWFKSANEAERHKKALHLRRHSWSCGAMMGPEDAIHRISDDLYVCGYCGEEFHRYDDSNFAEHLNHVHKFDECNKAKKFLRADHFRQHLKHSHAAISGKWTNTLEIACMKDEPLPEKLRAVTTSEDAIQASFALQSATTSMTRLSIPDAQITISPPLSPPRRISDVSTVANSGGQLANFSNAVNSGDTSAMSPSRRLPGEGLTSSGLPLGLSKRHFLRLINGGSDGSVTRKRRMSSPLSDSAKEGGWISPATPACNQAATMESSATEDCTKSPASLQRSFSAAEERKSESLHVCPTCQRSFARRTILTNHERTHTGEKPFSCTIEGCSQTFAQQGDKTRHEQAQHTEKTFICGNSRDEGPSWGCGKKFRRKDGLLEHHNKTKKGKQCLADRDKLAESNEDSLAIP